MSYGAIVGGVAVGALSLPFVLVAETVGGLGAVGLVLAAVLAVSVGLGSQQEQPPRNCQRCGTSNEPSNAVCTVCQAQL